MSAFKIASSAFFCARSISKAGIMWLKLNLLRAKNENSTSNHFKIYTDCNVVPDFFNLRSSPALYEMNYHTNIAPVPVKKSPLKKENLTANNYFIPPRKTYLSIKRT